MMTSNKDKYRKLLRRFGGGLFQSVLKIMREKGIQWTSYDCPVYNSTSGFWESENKITQPLYAVRYNISEESSITYIPFDSSMNNSNDVDNHSFEDFTGVKDSGNNAIFDNWTNINTGVGTHLAITGINSNTELDLVNAGAVYPEIYQIVDVTPETEYIYHFKYYSTELGRYGVYDETNAADIIATTNVSGVASTKYKTETVLFNTPIGCTQVRLRLSSAVALDSSFRVDEVNLMQPYDISVAFDLKRRYDSVNEDRDYFVSRLYSPLDSFINDRCWSIRAVGDEGDPSDQGKIRFSFSKTLDSSASGVYSDTILRSDIWYNIVCTAKYNGSGQTTSKVYINGVLENTSTVSNYIVNSLSPLTFGELLNIPYHPTNCDLANIQIAKREFTQTEVTSANNGDKLTNLEYYFNIDTYTSSQWVDSENGLVGTNVNTESIPKNTHNIKLTNSSISDFDGTTNYAILSSSINLGKSFTLKWIGSTGDVTCGIFGLNQANSESIRYSVSSKEFQYTTNATNGAFIFPYISDNEIHEFKIVRDGINAECFVDTVSIGTDTIDEINNTDTIIEQIGAIRDSHVLKFNGKLSEIDFDGEIVRFTEGASSISYFITSSNTLILYGTLTNIWGTGNVKPYNLIYGFDKWTLDSDPTTILRVPFDLDGNSIKTDGDTITGYTWVSRNLGCPDCKGHNGAESTLTQYASQKLIDADARLATPIWFTGTTPNDVEYSEITENAEGKFIWMNNVYNLPCKYDSLLLDPDLTLTAREKFQLERYLQQIEQYYTSEGAFLVTEGAFWVHTYDYEGDSYSF